MRPEHFIKFWPRLNNYGLGYELLIGGSTNDNRFITVDPVTVTIRSDDEIITDNKGPAFPSVPKESLQDLMDKLWALGFRPQDIGTAGHLKATQAHLEDAIFVRKTVMEQNAKLIDLWTSTNPPPQKP